MLQVYHHKSESSTVGKLKRILVVEPSAINWIGLQRLLGNVDTAGLNFSRVSKLAEAKKEIYEFKPNVIFFTSLPRGTDYLSMLSFLSDIASYHLKINSVIWLQHDMTWMVQLLHAFGVDTVLIDPVNLDEISQCFGGDPIEKVENKICLLGRKERLITLALLRGDTATAIADMTGRSVRTISMQKKLIFEKLNLVTNEDFYLLAGRLVNLNKKAVKSAER